MSEARAAIIAGVDGTEHSADAVALANTLAPALDAEVLAVVVHPFGDSDRTAGDEVILRDLADSAVAHMRKLGTEIDPERLELVADRSAARGLEREAEWRDAALITVGASQRSRLGRVLLGSTAERLMSGAPCPVAVAPSGYAGEPRQIATIGCAFDGSPESRLALRWASQLADRTGSRIRLLAVHEPRVSNSPLFQGISRVAQDEANRDDLSRTVQAAALDLRGTDMGVDASLLTGGAADELTAQSGEVDLLVIGSRGYGPSRAVLLGSVSAAVVRDAACPVVVVPRGA